MDPIKLFTAVEEVVYEIAAWVILLPKTIAQTLRDPAWPNTYLAEELTKEPSERYDEFMSPVLFWLLTAVVPMLVMRFTLFDSADARLTPFGDQLLDAALFLMSLPLAVSVGAELAHRAKVSRRRFRVQFGVQCYCFGVGHLVLTAGQVTDGLAPWQLGDSVYVPYFAWLLYAGVRVLHAQLAGNWKRVVWGLFAGYTMIWPSLLILYVMLSRILHQGHPA